MEEDTDSKGSAIVDLVVVDLDVVTAPRGDDTCQERGCRSTVRSMKYQEQKRVTYRV